MSYQASTTFRYHMFCTYECQNFTVTEIVSIGRRFLKVSCANSLCISCTSKPGQELDFLNYLRPVGRSGSSPVFAAAPGEEFGFKDTLEVKILEVSWQKMRVFYPRNSGS